MQWSKSSLSNKWYWNNWAYTYKKINLDTEFRLYTKINPKWIIDLNVKYQTVKCLEDNIGENLDELGFGDVFLDTKIKNKIHKRNNW